ncbi:hypothetical protein ACU4GA_26560 [Methylobacterium oryzae CBMB20]
MSSVPAVPVSEARASARDWLAVFGAILGAFTAILDIQITNASLADIQGRSAPPPRRELDLHRLPDGRDHRDPAHRLAVLGDRPAPLPRGEHAFCSPPSRWPARCPRP